MISTIGAGTLLPSQVFSDVGLLSMKAIAIRTGQQRQKGPGKFHSITTVACDKCDAQYVISHKRKLRASPTIAAAQAEELKMLLAEDHQPKARREHPDLVEFD